MPHLVLCEKIHRNWELNPRAKNDQFIVDLSEIIAKDGYNKEKYCIVFEIQGHDFLELACGHHRFEANLKAGNTEIYCEVRQGTMLDLIETMCADNEAFDPKKNRELGQLWTGTEKREAGKLRLLLPKYFAMSDRELAPLFGMDHHSSIGRWRADVISVAIAPFHNPYHIEEPRLTELRDLVAKREKQNKNRSEAAKRQTGGTATQPAEAPQASRDPSAVEKVEIELDRARENTKAAAAELKATWKLADFTCQYSEFLAFVSKAYDFELDVLRAICFTLSVPDGLSTFNNLTVAKLGTWRSRLNNLKGAIQRKDPVLNELRREPSDEKGLTDAGAPPVKSEKLILWEQVDTEIPLWKQRHQDQGIGHASKTMLLEATWKTLHTDEFPSGAAPDKEHLKFLLMYLQDDDTDFLAEVQRKLNPDAAPGPKKVDWGRIKSAMGTITTELNKVEWSDEEQTQIAQITTELQDVLKQYTGLSRSAKLWVLATLAEKYMEELDNVETD